MSTATAVASLAILAFLVIAVVVGFELVYAAREHKKEYEGFMLQAKQRGISFAEETLRNYPETGVESLRCSVEAHRNSPIPGDALFAEGIEEVLYNLSNMGRQNGRGW